MYFRTHQLEAAFNAGRNAQQQGKECPRDNPYDYRAERGLYHQWRAGFRHTENHDHLKGFGQDREQPVQDRDPFEEWKETE